MCGVCFALQLVLRSRVLSDEVTLRDVGVEANETVQVGVSSRRPHSHPLTLLAPAPPLTTPDVITVIVSQGKILQSPIVVLVCLAFSFIWIQIP